MTQLSLPEEILLLTLDDATGRPRGRQGIAAGLALAGAALMELALAGRVDTDGDRLLPGADPAPTGDAVLDRVQALLGAPGAPGDSRGALMLLAREEASLRIALLGRLVARGLLREQGQGRFLFLRTPARYPKAEGEQASGQVRARLRAVVLDPAGGIPEPRDALLLGLVRAAGLLPGLFSPGELAAAAERIALLARMEALNRSLGAAVADLCAVGLR